MQTMNEKLVLATRNPGKVAEMQALLPGFQLLSLDDVGFAEEIAEPFETFHENAEAKARAVFEHTRIPALSDDSGLCVAALDGAPGVLSKRYAGEQATDADNITKLLEAMRTEPDRAAHFTAVICLMDARGQPHSFEGICKGHIAEKPAGDRGFGYDPVFVPDGFDEPFAALPKEVKNNISHRAKALEKLKAYLAQGGADA